MKKTITREELAKQTIDSLRRVSDQLQSAQPLSEKFTCRKIVLDISVEPYTADKVREVRRLLNVSQSVFARFLGVSVSLVQKWERDHQQPHGAACRLMDEIRHDPKYWLNRFREISRVIEPASAK